MKSRNRLASTTETPARALVATLSAAGLMALSAMLGACNSTGCTDNRSALPLAGFYAAGGDTQISLDSIEIGGVGAPGDSLLVYAGEAAKEVYLPFRVSRDKTSFFIRYMYREQGLDNPAYNDTITFAYDSEPYFASEECGAMYRYRVTSVTHTRHLIDSVEITDSVVTNVEQERFRIYFNVSKPDEDDGTHDYTRRHTAGGRRAPRP